MTLQEQLQAFDQAAELMDLDHDQLLDEFANIAVVIDNHPAESSYSRDVRGEHVGYQTALRNEIIRRLCGPLAR